MHRVNLDEAATVCAESDLEIVRLDEALQELARLDARQAKVN